MLLNAIPDAVHAGKKVFRVPSVTVIVIIPAGPGGTLIILDGSKGSIFRMKFHHPCKLESLVSVEIVLAVSVSCNTDSGLICIGTTNGCGCECYLDWFPPVRNSIHVPRTLF